MTKKEGKKVEVPQLDIQRMTMTLVGDTPLITHRFSEKAKKEMLDKMQKKARTARAPKDPEVEFLASLYPVPPIKMELPVRIAKRLRWGQRAAGCLRVSS